MFGQWRTIHASVDERADGDFVRRKQRDELEGDDGVECHVASEGNEREQDDEEEADEDRNHRHIETRVNLNDGQQQLDSDC